MWRFKLTSNGVWWCSLVAAGTCWCLIVFYFGLDMCRGCLKSVSKGIWVLCMKFCKIWLRPRVYISVQACRVQQMLYDGPAPKGKIPSTWHFWNIKIPKPPYISSLKIIGLLHFLKFLGPSEENYNPQSLWITLYMVLPSQGGGESPGSPTCKRCRGGMDLVFWIIKEKQKDKPTITTNTV